MNLYPEDPCEGQVVDVPVSYSVIKLLNEDGTLIGTIQQLNEIVEMDTEDDSANATLECRGVTTDTPLWFKHKYNVQVWRHIQPKQVYLRFLWQPWGIPEFKLIRDYNVGLYLKEAHLMGVTGANTKQPKYNFSHIVFSNESNGLCTLSMSSEIWPWEEYFSKEDKLD